MSCLARLMKRIWQIASKVLTFITFRPVISVLGICLKKIIGYGKKYICAKMLILAGWINIIVKMG